MMIILSFSIVLRWCITKTSNLAFIGCHNVRLEYSWVVVTTFVCAQSWNDDVPVWALTRFSHIYYMSSDLHRHFLIFEYVIFPSLRYTISYPWTMSTYYLCIFSPFSFVSTLWRHFSVSFSFVSKLYPVLSPSISTLDSILSPPVSMLDLWEYRYHHLPLKYVWILPDCTHL